MYIPVLPVPAGILYTLVLPAGPVVDGFAGPAAVSQLLGSFLASMHTRIPVLKTVSHLLGSSQRHRIFYFFVKSGYDSYNISKDIIDICEYGTGQRYDRTGSMKTG